MKNLKLLVFASVVLTAGCKLDKVNDLPGPPDFSNFIAIGDSQTAGFANDGLYLDGQLASFPAVLAKQMATTFNQPLFGTNEKNGSGYLKLTGFTNTGAPIITRVTTELAIRGTIPVPGHGNTNLFTKYQGNINNYGITGIKLADLTNAQLGNTNGYFERLLSGNAPNNTTTYFDFAVSRPHTFFVCWLGANDVLGYAGSGGAGDTLTSKSYFNNRYALLINKLTDNKQKGVVATIADVTTIPYFNTVTVDSISKVAKAVNPLFAGLYITAKSNADITETTYVPRLATTTDLILLGFDVGKIGNPVSTSAGMQPYGLTPLAPIENKYVLDQNEIAIVRDYVAAYNNTIKTIAKTKNLAVYDVYTFFNTLKKDGLTINGVKLTANYITSGIFSLDGIHSTPRGSAATANQFIAAINAQYQTSLQPVDISTYGTLP
ncbi:MAG: SGNH/GDSL hydrolase family protein [Mucilaginibacter sp.]